MSGEDQSQGGPPRPGGKAAERLREQLSREFGENPPAGPLDSLEDATDEGEQTPTDDCDGTNARGK